MKLKAPSGESQVRQTYGQICPTIVLPTNCVVVKESTHTKLIPHVSHNGCKCRHCCRVSLFRLGPVPSSNPTLVRDACNSSSSLSTMLLWKGPQVADVGSGSREPRSRFCPAQFCGAALALPAIRVGTLSLPVHT